MKIKSSVIAGILVNILSYCNVPNNRDKSEEIFVSKPDTTLVSSRDTTVFSSFKEIDSYYKPQFDSILIERQIFFVKKNNQTQNYVQIMERLDSSLFSLQWEKNQSIIKYLKNNHKENMDLLPLFALINAHEVNIDELYDLFNSFPKIERESQQGQIVSKALSERKNKEGLQKLSYSNLQHNFYELNGNTLQLSLVRNEFIVLELWASWCLPCRVSNKQLLKWYKSLDKPNKRLSIVAISLDTSKEKWLNAVQKDSIEVFVNISDLKGWESAFIKSLNVSSIPFRILINTDGKVIAFNNSTESLNSIIRY